ncbi:hypothetical protein [Paracoccus homiensis]|uniref:Tetratricopeptide repeat-containing protein n=1 Tax=Paracoccus homiensis TaxID=364199 RepID=A0A1I0CDE4_9RHOB|nr:hypothetical protein [Paracoccus homiensis]SET17575.1 hypothetical protein SAMN04489858_103276 [Paracoccus homiensis]
MRVTQQAPIVGFRRDRIGARLIGLLNVLRLGQIYEAEAVYLWLADPTGHYPELADPHDFLCGDFIDRHIRIVGGMPDLTGRSNLSALAMTVDAASFRQRLARGELFHSDAAFEMTCLLGESRDEAHRQAVRIAADLPLAPRLAERLAEGRRRLAEWAGDRGAIRALHLRRGDLLDGDPWSLSSWPAKYVPDEFCRVWIDQQPGPVVVFTDTPAATAHLAQGDPRVVPVDQVLDLDGLNAAERDMLEVLVMAGATRIGAPGGSAFSRAALTIGHAQLDSLPRSLPPQENQDAHQALLDRVISRPDSFLCSGDLAQSAQHALHHAITTGQGAALADALAAMSDAAARHPFLYRIAAVSALHAGRHDTARDVAARALAAPNLVPRDTRECQQVQDTVGVIGDPQSPASLDAFLLACFGEKAHHRPVRDMMAAALFGQPGSTALRLLMLPGWQAQDLAERAEAAVPPLWSYLGDWEELLDDVTARQPLREMPDLHRKMLQSGRDGLIADEAFASGAAPDTPRDAYGTARIGLAASALSLHGRYARALRLLHWLDEVQPGDAMINKRLADTCFRLGNADLGFEFLGAALDAMPDNVLLHLSMARRAAVAGRAAQALDRLEQAAGLLQAPRLLQRQGRRVRQALAA